MNRRLYSPFLSILLASSLIASIRRNAAAVGDHDSNLTPRPEIRTETGERPAEARTQEIGSLDERVTPPIDAADGLKDDAAASPATGTPAQAQPPKNLPIPVVAQTQGAATLPAILIGPKMPRASTPPDEIDWFGGDEGGEYYGGGSYTFFDSGPKEAVRIAELSDVLLRQEKKTILFVDSGFAGLSGMAHYLAKDALKKIGEPNIKVVSRDLALEPNSAMPFGAAAQLKRDGIDTRLYRSKAPTADDIRRADVILTTDSDARSALIKAHPDAESKAFTLKKFADSGWGDIKDPVREFHSEYASVARSIRWAAEDLAGKFEAHFKKKTLATHDDVPSDPMGPRLSILITSSYNQLRGPLAEFFTRHELDKKGFGNIRVSSRSTDPTAKAGRKMESRALSELAKEEIDGQAHRTVRLSDREIRKSDVILAMDKSEIEQIVARVPEAASKVFLFKEFSSKWNTGSPEIEHPVATFARHYQSTASELKEALSTIFESISATAEAAARAADAGARWVYFICDANHSRSPLAERLFKHRFKEAGLDDIKVASRARWGGSGRSHFTPRDKNGSMNPLSGDILDEKGIPFEPHGSQGLSQRDARRAEVLLVMQYDQKEDVEKRFPAARGKVHMLTEFGGQSGEIIDKPHTLEVFRHLAQQMEDSVAGIVARLRVP